MQEQVLAFDDPFDVLVAMNNMNTFIGIDVVLFLFPNDLFVRIDLDALCKTAIDRLYR